MSKRYLIVGGVAGGAGVAARLRRLDEQAEIIIYERGHHISFANCGLPYYAGGTIQDREKLFVMTPQKLKASLNIEAKVRHEVINIDKEAKTITVKNLEEDKTTTESYDKLILSPGASPIRSPLEGIDDKSIYTLRSVSDIDSIKEKIDNPATKRAVVIGAGFIGIEMAENLHHRGIKVTVIEAQEQIMSVVDYDMASLVQSHLRAKGVQLQLNDAVKSFERRNGELFVLLNSGQEIPCDMVILSIGVRPDSILAKNAELALSERGAIKVNEYFQTSDENIYAVGDAILYKSPLLNTEVNIPLAGPANKQARICADNIVKGNTKTYSGSIGTSIAKVFDMNIASTGLTEKALERAGLPYKEIITHAPNHAGYYPGANFLSVKVLYNPEDGRLWGGQVVGGDGVDKRVDALAAYTMQGAKIYDLADYEHAYAPPFASAKDPLNMIGFISENIQDGLTELCTWKDYANYKKDDSFFLLDVRTPQEFELGNIEGAVNIPHTVLRTRLSEVPKDKTIIINCQIGLRGYLAERVLRQNGYSNVKNLTGGYKTYSFAMKEKELLENPQKLSADFFSNTGRLNGDDHEDDGSFRNTNSANENLSSQIEIDTCGLQCPGPIMQVKKGVEQLGVGGVLEIKATDPGFSRDIQSWCKLTRNELLHLTSEGGTIQAQIRKGSKQQGGNNMPTQNADGATFIVFSNDMDKALASFVLANGALATGKKVTMFFTFWGLSVLRKEKAPKVKKDFMGKMFGSMLPKGMDKLSLSSMNFGGMGSKMMKSRMKNKNVDQLEEMFKQALDAGVRLVACQMSMDIMGISADELIDGVEIGGVASYMQAASESGINLFI